MKMNVLIWNEHIHEQNNPLVQNVYPDGIHGAIASCFKGMTNVHVQTATLADKEHGLTEEQLAKTDVLIWWGHVAHDQVEDPIVDRVQKRVLEGMGLLVLHSGHFSKIFKRLMGTSCDLKWREADEKERIWVVDPSHPIAEGIGEYIVLEKEEMYGEHFDIPVPDELVMVSWFEGGEVFRSCATYRRGNGKVVYFRPGHETYPTYYHEDIRKVIVNCVKWLAPVRRGGPVYGNAKPLETISEK